MRWVRPVMSFRTTPVLLIFEPTIGCIEPARANSAAVATASDPTRAAKRYRFSLFVVRMLDACFAIVPDCFGGGLSLTFPIAFAHIVAVINAHDQSPRFPVPAC